MSPRNVFALRLRKSAIGVVAVLLLCSGCSKKVPVGDGAAQLGIASWYGHPFDGRLTSNGEVYDMEKLDRAHRTFPFGTVVA